MAGQKEANKIADEQAKKVSALHQNVETRRQLPSALQNFGTTAEVLWTRASTGSPVVETMWLGERRGRSDWPLGGSTLCASSRGPRLRPWERSQKPTILPRRGASGSVGDAASNAKNQSCCSPQSKPMDNPRLGSDT